MYTKKTKENCVDIQQWCSCYLLSRHECCGSHTSENTRLNQWAAILLQHIHAFPTSTLSTVRFSNRLILKNETGSGCFYCAVPRWFVCSHGGGRQRKLKANSLAGFHHVWRWRRCRLVVNVSCLCDSPGIYVKRTHTTVILKTTPTMDDCAQERPLFTFGVIADIQYANIDDGYNYSRSRRRYYRSSLQLLRNAQESWSESAVKPEFILQLGDIIDGFNKGHNASERALDTVLREFSSSPVEVHHVWGNHEFYNFSRSALLGSKLNSTLHTDRILSETRPGPEIYAYHFSPFPGFTFVVLDAYDVSLLGREESSEQYKSAMNVIRQYNNNEDLNCPPGNFYISVYFLMYSNKRLKLPSDSGGKVRLYGNIT